MSYAGKDCVARLDEKIIMEVLDFCKKKGMKGRITEKSKK